MAALRSHSTGAGGQARGGEGKPDTGACPTAVPSPGSTGGTGLAAGQLRVSSRHHVTEQGPSPGPGGVQLQRWIRDKGGETSF